MADMSGIGSALSGMVSGPFSESRVGSAGGVGAPSVAPKAPGAQTGASFLETLQGAFNGVNEQQMHADKVSRDFAGGAGGNLHDVMIAMEKAEIGLRTLSSVRNKVVEAYQEIMRMQV